MALVILLMLGEEAAYGITQKTIPALESTL